MEAISSNLLAVALISAVVSVILTVVITKVLAKTGIFRYTVAINQVALSADDAIFGPVRVSWRDQVVRNLYTVTFEVENSTYKDFETVKFVVYSGAETTLLGEKTAVVNSPNIVPWSETFKSEMLVANGAQASASQLEQYYHRREYDIGVFNRGQVLRFVYLCTRPNDDDQPQVFLDTQTKGVKLKRYAGSVITVGPILGVPLGSALLRGLLFSIIIVMLCGYFLQNAWLIAGISMFVGLTCQVFGAIMYKIERFTKSLISG